MGEHDGDIVFKSPTKEFLRLRGDGAILVEGRRACSDPEVYVAFKRWIAGGTVTRPDGTKEPILRDEDRDRALDWLMRVIDANAGTSFAESQFSVRSAKHERGAITLDTELGRWKITVERDRREMIAHSYGRNAACPACGDLDGCHKWDEPKAGELSFQSGVGLSREAPGGNVTLEAGGAPTPSVAAKTRRPELDGCDAEILWALVKKHGFLRVLRVLESQALKLGPMSGVRLAEQINPSRFEGKEPMDETP